MINTFGICDSTNRKSICEPYFIESTRIISPLPIRHPGSRFARDLQNIDDVDFEGGLKKKTGRHSLVSKLKTMCKKSDTLDGKKFST